jgi:hypothetical protein
MRAVCACLLAALIVGCAWRGDATESDTPGREDGNPGHVGKPGESKLAAPRE